MSKSLIPLVAFVATVGAGSALAVEINYLDGSQGVGSTTSGTGTVEIVDLTGVGGNLENNAPLPTGAAKLTTPDGGAKSDIFVSGEFGTLQELIDNDFSISYSWFDLSGSGDAAPSLKLAFSNLTHPTDTYGQFIFEPYFQGATPGATTPTQGDWATTTITGSSGFAWHTGIFGQGNLAGGPANYTLSGWASQFGSYLFDAELIGIGIGLGSNNPNEVGYVDNIVISGTALDATYDFEAAPAIPVPASLPLLIGSGMALAGLRARRKRR